MPFVCVHKGCKERRKEKARKGHWKKTNADRIANGYEILKDRKDRFNLVGSQAYVEKLEMHRQIAALQKQHEVVWEDVTDVENRINEFFDIVGKYKNKPTVAGLALALGIDRQKLGRIMSGRDEGKTYSVEVRQLLHSIYVMYESMWEQSMNDGDIPTNSGIFIGKNQFGYKDVVEHEIVADVKPQIDTAAIMARYSDTTADNEVKYIGADNELPEDHNKKDDDDAE